MSGYEQTAENDAPFFWDTETGEPCPRRGNVLCTLPWTPRHRHAHREHADKDDAALDRAQADGRISVEDADTIRDFGAFLADPSSRCAICLTDDLDGATWKRHDRLGRFPICQTCVTPPASNEGGAR